MRVKVIKITAASILRANAIHARMIRKDSVGAESFRQISSAISISDCHGEVFFKDPLASSVAFDTTESNVDDVAGPRGIGCRNGADAAGYEQRRQSQHRQYVAKAFGGRSHGEPVASNKHKVAPGIEICTAVASLG